MFLFDTQLMLDGFLLITRPRPSGVFFKRTFGGSYELVDIPPQAQAVHANYDVAISACDVAMLTCTCTY